MQSLVRSRIGDGKGEDKIKRFIISLQILNIEKITYYPLFENLLAGERLHASFPHFMGYLRPKHISINASNYYKTTTK